MMHFLFLFLQKCLDLPQMGAVRQNFGNDYDGRPIPTMMMMIKMMIMLMIIMLMIIMMMMMIKKANESSPRIPSLHQRLVRGATIF